MSINIVEIFSSEVRILDVRSRGSKRFRTLRFGSCLEMTLEIFKELGISECRKSLFEKLVDISFRIEEIRNLWYSWFYLF